MKKKICLSFIFTLLFFLQQHRIYAQQSPTIFVGSAYYTNELFLAEIEGYTCIFPATLGTLKDESFQHLLYCQSYMATGTLYFNKNIFHNSITFKK